MAISDIAVIALVPAASGDSFARSRSTPWPRAVIAATLVAARPALGDC
jgi:hypothetical protein